MKKIIGIPALIFAATTLSYGQATSVNGGSIQGAITDPSGAVVPGSSVSITSVDTNAVKTVTTDSAGYYSVGPLNPGSYTIVVTKPGFEKLSVTTVIRTGTATNGSFKMTLGSSSETVEVNAGALQVNTEQFGVSGVVTREQIESLPINGRNFLDVAQIQPGVILQSGETFDPTKAGYSAISVGGVSGRTTRILLDGQDITDETVGTTIFNVTTGAIDEFQLNRSTQDVSGEVTSTGQVLVSTRTGTNAIHGQIFYNFQDHRVGFARTTGGFDAPFQRNQFGGYLGGPIVKDKLFFFGDFERIKQDVQGSATTSPTFAPIQTSFPFIPSPFRDTYNTIRVDYNGPKGIHLFARGAYSVNSARANFGNLYSLYTSRNNVPALVGGADFTMGRFTHSIRGGYEKFHNVLTDGTAGVTSIYNPSALIGVPVTLSDTTDGFYAGPNFLAPQGTFQSDKQLRYDGSWTHGSHTVKYGASLNRILGGGFAAFYGPSLYTQFNPGTLLPNGDPADPINGYFASLYILGNGNGLFTEKPAFGLTGGGTFDWRTGAYVADTWKVSEYVSLTGGLRWSVDTDRANQDLASPRCSDVALSLQFAGCSTADGTGDSFLFNQFGPGLGGKTHQPYGNFGPQLGINVSPGDHKTSFHGGIGVFYESDIFNNTSNARSSVTKSNGNFFNLTTVCGGTNTVTLPNGQVVTSVNGVSLATICGQSIKQAAPQITALRSQYQAASSTGGPNPGFIGAGGGLKTTGIYGAPYLTPYSIQFNGGVQHELAKGIILSVDYVHNATIKIPLLIDKNHVGAARTLDPAAAKAAVANTLAYCNATTIAQATSPGGCTPSGTAAFAADITTFAAQGLDSSNQYSGGYPVSFTGQNAAAFPGINPNVGLGEFIVPVGRSGYDALQIVVQQQKTHPAPGILSSNFQASYSLSRSVSPISPGTTNNSADQFFNSLPLDFDNPNAFQGRSTLDHSNELSFGGSAAVKYGLTIGAIGHFFSANATTLTLDNTSGRAGEIFRTDVTGDGTTGDVVPGTLPGYYEHQIKGAGLNQLINSYNAVNAGQPTPAGQALLNAGVLTLADLRSLGAVQQQIATAPTTPLQNPAFRAFDVNASYPIRFSRFRESLNIVPAVAIYNVANMSNFAGLHGTLANVTTAGGGVGQTNGFLNGPNNLGLQDSNRTQRGSGTFDQGAPRTTEFSLKINF